MLTMGMKVVLLVYFQAITISTFCSPYSACRSVIQIQISGVERKLFHLSVKMKKYRVFTAIHSHKSAIDTLGINPAEGIAEL